MLTIAFLLCPSAIKDADQLERYTHDQAYHQDQLRLTMSGNRLYRAFGSDAYSKIWWDNANPDPDSIRPNLSHISSVLIKHKPKIILSFGKVAEDGVDICLDSISANKIGIPFHMNCHHPNARHRTQEDLDQFAIAVLREIKNQEL